MAARTSSENATRLHTFAITYGLFQNVMFAKCASTILELNCISGLEKRRMSSSAQFVDILHNRLFHLMDRTGMSTKCTKIEGLCKACKTFFRSLLNMQICDVLFAVIVASWFLTISSQYLRAKTYVSPLTSFAKFLFSLQHSFLFKAINEIFIERVSPGQNSVEYNSQGVINLFCNFFPLFFFSFEQVIHLIVYEGRSGCRNILRH